MLLVLKLFFLGVRQISKPIANRAKDAAHSSGLMKAVAVGLGRGMYRLQTQVTRLSEGKPPLLRVAQLEEEDAVVCTARNRHPAGPGHLLVPLGLVDVNTRSRPRRAPGQRRRYAVRDDHLFGGGRDGGLRVQPVRPPSSRVPSHAPHYTPVPSCTHSLVSRCSQHAQGQEEEGGHGARGRASAPGGKPAERGAAVGRVHGAAAWSTV